MEIQNEWTTVVLGILELKSNAQWTAPDVLPTTLDFE